jgi:hypothetical protein
LDKSFLENCVKSPVLIGKSETLADDKIGQMATCNKDVLENKKCLPTSLVFTPGLRMTALLSIEEWHDQVGQDFGQNDRHGHELHGGVTVPVLGGQVLQEGEAVPVPVHGQVLQGGETVPVSVSGRVLQGGETVPVPVHG